MSSFDEGIKVIFLGETFVGKTSLINVSIGRKYDSNEESTLTSNYSVKPFDYKGQKFTFYLWDTIGQEKYRSLTNMFFKDSNIVILVYDITNLNTFNQLEYWHNQVVKQLTEEGYILAIVGNKQDLFKDEKVKEEQGKKFASEINAKFKLSSAKDDPLSFTQFLEELFKEFIDKNMDKLRKKRAERGSMMIKSNKNKKKKHKCC